MNGCIKLNRKSHEERLCAKDTFYIDALNPSIAHWPDVADRKTQFSDLLLQETQLTDVSRYRPDAPTMLPIGSGQLMSEHNTRS